MPKLPGFYIFKPMRRLNLPDNLFTSRNKFGICVVLWLAFQLALLSFPGLADARGFALLLCGAGGAWFFSIRREKREIVLPALPQSISLVLLFAALGQGAALGLPRPELAWALPALGSLPAFYTAFRRRSQFFALLGCAGALGLPAGLGLFQGEPDLFSVYILIFCLPLPFIARHTGWRLLLLCLPGAFLTWCWFMFLHLAQEGISERLQIIFLIFTALYLAALYQRLRHPGFNPHSFPDFLLSLGGVLAVALYQLRLSAWSNDRLILSLAALAALSACLCLLLRRILKEKGRDLFYLHLLLSLFFFNACLHFLLGATPALGLYCLEGAVLFSLGGKRGSRRIRGTALLFVLSLSLYYFLSDAILPGALFIACSLLVCAFARDREMKRLGRRSGRNCCSSGLEFFLLLSGFAWFFSGLGAFVFKNASFPGLVFFASSSVCAYFFYALGKIIRFRSLRLAIFLPMFVSIPAAILPLAYQARLEWPVFDNMFSYNYLSDLGLLAWGIYFVTVWTALYRNWGGLISNRRHAFFIGLVILELILILTSSCRAFILESGVSPSFLSALSALPSLLCISFISHLSKIRPIFRPYRQVVLILVPTILFLILALWFVFSLSSQGSEAPGGKYLPLLNPVEITQLACVAVFAHWQRRLRKSRIPGPHLSEGRLFWVYGFFAFLWLHGLMFRVLQYFSRAEPEEVFGFTDLHFIFACIWVLSGITLWLCSTRYASLLSWFLGLVLLLAGDAALAVISLGLWGQLTATFLILAALLVFILLCWRSPAPFTAGGKKLARP
ncbi:MAG: DUF2339 domain-containing protein [Deltaproteobacteria bacterium]|nr:DUF2339 domain-containing protein [Deltaproteobacteria bacterium]